MSDAVFPDLPGLDIVVRKTPTWSTRIQTAASGKELRADFFVYPLYRIALSYNVLRAGAEAELQSIVGFFNQRRGRFDNFLFSDPGDSSVTAQQFGVGDGSTTAFQLVRGFGGHVEPVMNLNGSPTIKVNGVTKTAGTDYTIDAYGMVTFAAAPDGGAPLTWNGDYYYRVRFDRDGEEFERFLDDLWRAQRIELFGSLGTLI